MADKTDNKSRRKVLEGTVVSNSMDKTVKVKVETTTSHPVYKKVISKRKIFFARTEDKLEVGDTVKIIESKPYSKKVRWTVVK